MASPTALRVKAVRDIGYVPDYDDSQLIWYTLVLSKNKRVPSFMSHEDLIQDESGTEYTEARFGDVLQAREFLLRHASLCSPFRELKVVDGKGFEVHRIPNT